MIDSFKRQQLAGFIFLIALALWLKWGLSATAISLPLLVLASIHLLTFGVIFLSPLKRLFVYGVSALCLLGQSFLGAVIAALAFQDPWATLVEAILWILAVPYFLFGNTIFGIE